MSRKLPKATQFERRRNQAKRNEEALAGKVALLATYEDMGLSRDPYCRQLIKRVQKERNYYRVRSFHTKDA